MKKFQKHLPSIVLSIIFVSIAGFITYKSTQPRVVAPSVNQQDASQQESTAEFITVTQSIYFNNAIEPVKTTSKVASGSTALQALEENFEIVKKGEGENAFITAIKGIEASESDKTFGPFTSMVNRQKLVPAVIALIITTTSNGNSKHINSRGYIGRRFHAAYSTCSKYCSYRSNGAFLRILPKEL